MAAIRPRLFAAGNHGYHNATLGTTGVALALPTGCQGFLLSVSAGCFVGVRGDNTLLTFNDANYGSVRAGDLPPFSTQGWAGTEDYIHIAPWTGTAEVSICFL